MSLRTRRILHLAVLFTAGLTVGAGQDRFFTYYNTWCMGRDNQWSLLRAYYLSAKTYAQVVGNTTHVMVFNTNDIVFDDYEPYFSVTQEYAQNRFAATADKARSERDSLNLLFNGYNNPGSGYSDWLDRGTIFDLRDSLHAKGKFILITLQAVRADLGLNTVVKDSQKTEIFAKAVAGYIERHDFDGVDLNTEQGATFTESELARFFRILRRHMPDKLITTVPLSTHWDRYAEAMEYIDFVLPQFYNYKSNWDPNCGSNGVFLSAPLYNVDIPLGSNHQSLQTWGPLQWSASGWPKEKIVILLSNEATPARGVDTIFACAPGSLPFWPDTAAYAMLSRGGTMGWDSIHIGSYIYGTSTETFRSANTTIDSLQKFYIPFLSDRNIDSVVAWGRRNGFNNYGLYDVSTDSRALETVKTPRHAHMGSLLNVTGAAPKPGAQDIAVVRVDTDINFVPDRMGDTVTVVGDVNSINPTASADRWQYYIQDATGGITVTKGGETGGGRVFNIGDRIAVTGIVGHFNGMVQIDVADVNADVTFVGSGFTVIPQQVTIEELVGNAEEYEAELVKIVGVAPAAGSSAWPASSDANLTIWDGDRQLSLRVDSDTDIDGSAEPVWPATITGTFVQFDASDPRDGNYQLQPNFRADFSEGIAVGPNPNFRLLSPANNSAISLSDGYIGSFAWDRAVDLNGDNLVYNWVPVGYPSDVKGPTLDTSFSWAVNDLRGVIVGSEDSVILRWTVSVKDAGPLVASVDTFTVIFRRGTLSGVTDESEIPDEYALQQNYPNPFNPTTRIKVSLPLASSVRLKVYNLLGQEVVTLLDGSRSEGFVEVQWNARDEQGRPVGSGVYVYRLEAQSLDGSRDFTQTRRMILMK